ncbi:MAG: hypothetical protein QM709_03585 [Spongiibacteraceae bacterium]
MMTKLFKGIGVLLAVIVSAYFLLIDGLIKSQLERYGSQALHAPLTIGKVTFHLLPTSLTLRDVQIGNQRLPSHNLIQFDELSLPFSLRDLIAHKLIVDTIDVRGLRFHRPHDAQSAAMAETQTPSNSPQLREALQRVQQMRNNPMASNTIDPNISLSGALFSDQFKPLLTQISTALNALTATPNSLGDWQILARRVNLDGTFDVGSSGVRFLGTLDNVTPQPALFNVVTQLELQQAEGEVATLRVKASLDKRKLAQATLRFDLARLPLSDYPLSTDPALKLVIRNATTDAQAMLSLTGNQFDLNVLTTLQQVRFDIANGDDEIARTIADVCRHTTMFDIHLQASGDLANPRLKLNSSLDVPLANALQQLQPTAAMPSSAAFPSP